MKKMNIAERAAEAAGLLDMKDEISARIGEFKDHVVKAFALLGLMTILAALFTWGAYQYNCEFAHEFWLGFGNLAILVFGLYFTICGIMRIIMPVTCWLLDFGIRRLGFTEAGIERMALHY